MSVSPIIPLIGLALVIFNVALAAFRPYLPPKAMGIQLFFGGMTTLIIAVLDLVNPLGIAEYERILLFIAGCINCSLGYYMVLREMQSQGA